MGALNLTQQHRINLRQQAKIEYELARRNSRQQLSALIRFVWPVIEPGNVYLHNWHIDVLSDHLAAVRTFEIPKLIINMPPRSMKSICCTVGFNAWVWIDNPEKRFIFGTYAQALSNRDAMKCRDIVTSPLYKSAFDIKWSIREDQNEKRRFENTKTGVRFSTSVDGTLTGEGGDYLIADDIQNKAEIKSKNYRDTTRDFFKGLATRANQLGRSSTVVIQQRLHEDDVSGRLLKEKLGYELLVLPMEHELKPRIISYTSLGYKDPRTKEKEPLWIEKFPPKALEGLKKDLDDTAHAELQQDPKPQSGGLIKKEWWKRFSSAPSQVLEVIQFWDCAQKPGITNDYSVCATWARTSNAFYRIGYWRGKTDYPLLETMAKLQYEEFKPDAIVIEDASAGSSLIQWLLTETSYPVIPFNPGRIGSKEVRASAAAPTVKAGKCYLPEKALDKSDPNWEHEDAFIDEHERFPKGNNDDTVDTTSMMVIYFRGTGNDEGRPSASVA